MRKLLIIAVLVACFGGFYFYNSLQHRCEFKKTDGTCLKIIYAESEAERAKGLSDRDSLPADTGMLFVFPEDGHHGFWMKDMRFNIDIVWLDSNKKILHIEPNVSPDSYPKTFASPTPSRYVLELKAGEAAQLQR